MSNQTSRILSGVVLVLLVLLCLSIGQSFSLGTLALLGFLIVDEIITHFYEQKRRTLKYALAQSSFVGFYLFLNFFQENHRFEYWILAGVFLDFLLLLYLFLVDKKSDRLIQVFKTTSWGAGFYVLIPFISLSSIIHMGLWKELFGGLLILNFMVDTAAYFTGKKFGRHKLWEAVSPKKTREGFVGGVLFSVIFTSLYWYFVVDKLSFFSVFFFIIIACCSQIGDLTQSKLKRQFNLKDSSSLIPGHGGVYDRLDSLLFVAPLYALFVYFM